MAQTLHVAVIQLASNTDKDQNVATAQALCEEAISNKATLLVLPEVFNYRNPELSNIDAAESIPGPSLVPLIKCAKKHAVFIIAGSIMEAIPKNTHCYNTSVLITPEGTCNTLYRKQHLFDVKIKEKQIQESRLFKAGETPVMANIQGFSFGFSICYDLRFPELFRYYSQQGAQCLVVPSSFTYETGKAHWETLCRSRAIENSCYLLAPNQAGIGTNGLKTYGNSMIIDPWGTILARASTDTPEIIYATLEKSLLNNIRQTFPVLKHRRSQNSYV